jgi:hypothetical protein
MAITGCGGKQTMASKSAAAYDEAKKNGIPIATGEHGGHSNTGSQTAGTPAAETDHGPMAGMDHSTMAGMDHSAMPVMPQSKMPGMQHGSAAPRPHAMAGMEHAAMPGMAPAPTPGTQHDGGMATMPGMQHGSVDAPAARSAGQTTVTAIVETQPAATLRADEFDTPAASSIGEAAKGAPRMAPMERAPPPRQDQKPPQSPPAPHHHGNGEAS